MTNADARAIEAVTRRIRACFNRLAALADRLHRDLGITAAMRAVIEALYEGGDRTVPSIARSKSVSRQHIQLLVNGLIEARLARAVENPADRRSPLIALTDQGRAAFERMREREKAVLAELATTLARHDVGETLATLEALQTYLDRKLRE